MAAQMHHRKQGARIPWTGMVRFDGKPEFRLGTVYTTSHDPAEARAALCRLADELFPAGWSLGWFGRGALIYKPHTPADSGDPGAHQ